MSDGIGQQISLFRSQIVNRRFDDGTIRILESVLVTNDVKSLLEVRSKLIEFMRHEFFSVIHEIAEKSVEQKLSVIEFLVRAFALAGDVESCLALRYEALVMREIKSTSSQWLRVSCREWLTFAEHSLDNRFSFIAIKACEKALSCYQMNDMIHPLTDDHFENEKVIEKIKRLKEVAVVSAASRSVQAQAVEYLKRKTLEHSIHRSPVYKERRCFASTLFRNGIKKRNKRKLQEHCSLQKSPATQC